MAAREAMRQVQAFQWQQQRPVADEPEERDIAVDPFSLRQFSRLDIDGPLPIPSVSVADRHHASPPARQHGTWSSPISAASSSSTRVSIAGRMNALAEATGWEDAARPASSTVHKAPSVVAMPRGESSSAGAAGVGTTTELADGGGFDVLLSSSGRKASEPQRWGSDVPLIAAADAEEEQDSTGYYSFPNARRKNGRDRARRAAVDAPFRCCMYVPGLSSRRGKPAMPTPPPALPRSSSSSVAFSGAAATAEKQHSECTENNPFATARQSTVSLAVSLERFDCGSLSTSSWGDLDLDGEVSSSSYFDLPLELVLGSDDGDDLPVCAAFVFESDVIRKSVIKRRSGEGVGDAPCSSMGRVSTMDASGRSSAARVSVSLKSRAPLAPTSP